ncbi:MAG: GIY-YIG nuclease family protein [Minisyncoccota bacterium]
MFYFYTLKSKKDGNLYFGYSSDLRKRFREHNMGKVISTKDRRPLEIIYYEAYKDEGDARERERQIKKRAGALISLKRRLDGSLKF